MAAVSALRIAPEVFAATRSGMPVVALESAVITHGLPRAAALEAVERQWRSCETAGAVPAVVAVFEGELRVGLSRNDLAAPAARSESVKVSPWNLAASLERPGFGGTTVAATVVAAARAGIPIVSTGGIGGVHPGDGQDVSADLTELSRRPVAVVCAGPKSTLHAVATLERLETLGVPVIGWRSGLLAGFLASSVGLRLPVRADSLAELAALLRRPWELGGAGGGVSPAPPGGLAIPLHRPTAEPSGAERGSDRTPAELARLQARLGDRVIRANTSLLERNAALAAGLAAALVGHG